MDKSIKELQLEIIRLKEELNVYKSETKNSLPGHQDILHFLDSLNIGFLQLDKEITITKLNEAAAKMLEANKVQLLGKKLFDTGWNLFTEKYEILSKENIKSYLLHPKTNLLEKTIILVNKSNNVHQWINVLIRPMPLSGKENNHEFSIVIQNIDNQKKKELKQVLKQDTILSQILAQLHSIDSKCTDIKINRVLKTLGNFFMADLSYIYSFDAQNTSIFKTNEWHKKKDYKKEKDKEKLTMEMFSWSINKLMRNETICFRHINEMPAEARSDKEFLHSQSVKSILISPIIKTGKTIGFIGVHSEKHTVIWKESDISMLRLIATALENIVETIDKKESEKKINENNNQISDKNNEIINATDAIIFSTTTDGTIKTFNSAAEKKLGYKMSEVVGQTSANCLLDNENLCGKIMPFNIYHQNTINHFEHTYPSTEENFHSVECNFKSKSGNKIPVLLQLNSVKSNDGEIKQYIGIAIDRRNVKEKKEQAFKLQLAALKNLPSALIITDIKGNILYANKTYQELTDFSIHELVGEKAICLRRPDFNKSQLYKNIVTTCIDRGLIWKGELAGKRKNGDIYFTEASITPIKNKHGEIVNFIVVEVDITEKKKQERQLKKSRELNQAVLNNYPDLLFLLNKNGKCLNVFNENRITLFYREEFLRKNRRQSFPAELQQKNMEALNNAFKNNNEVRFEYILPFNQKQRHFENRIVSISPNQSFCVVRDITHFKKGEKSLNLKLAQMQALIENFSMPILFESPSHKITIVTKHFCHLFDVQETPSALIGTNVNDFAKRVSHLTSEPEKFISNMEMLREEKGKRQSWQELQLRDGRVYEWKCIPVHYENKLIGYLTQFRKVNKNKTIEKYCFIQQEMGFRLATITSLSDAADIIINTILKIEQICGASIYLLNKNTQSYDLAAAQGLPDNHIQKSASHRKGSAVHNFITNGEIQFSDYSTTEIYSEKPENNDQKLVCSFPIVYRDNTWGALNIASKNRYFTPELINTLKIISTQIGGALLRITTQNELLTSKKNFRLFFEFCDDYMLVINEKGDIIKTNPITEKLLGYTQKEFEKMSVIDIHPPDRHEEARHFIKEMLAGREKICLIPWFSQKGQLIPVESKIAKGEWDGKSAFFCISRNITERLEAEVSLQRSEARWQFALESSGDGIWDWNMKTMNIFYSTNLKRILAYSDDDKINNVRKWKSIIHPSDFSKVQKDLLAHIKGKTPLFKNEHRLLCSNGKYKWILSRGKIISYDSKGKPERMIGTLIDISARKLNEISLLNSLQKERELNELKSRFVSMTSHEFRTPLATMLLATDSLEVYWERMSTNDILKRIKQIKGNVIFLKEIIEKVLDLSHLDSGKIKYRPSLTNINELILNIVNGYLARPELKHIITYNSINKQTNWMLDRQMITQVFNNLLDNAIKYSEPGTRIDLKSYDVGNKLKIKITDQGIGISEQDAKTIWDPFVRGSNVENIHGTGLGLALAKQMVKMHGGDLTLQSELNKGTTFILWLPA